MLLGALLDAGAPLRPVQEAVDALGVGRIRLTVRPVRRGGLAATKVDVGAPAGQGTRTWRDVRELVERADLPEPVRAGALDAFARLARAEAAAHRMDPDDVHFHEVGALDAIADVVGCRMALHALGITEAVCTPVALGGGMVRAEHGLIPVPGPAVLELLREAGAPVYSGHARHELCTPTGAALLAATVDRWGELPPMRISAVGLGAGNRELSEVPNVVRVVVGEPAPAGSGPGESGGGSVREQLLVETNVDDLDPRLWPGVLAALLDAGAADAWLTPILMKKGRPAHTLSVLVDADRANPVRRTIFAETSTIGLREHAVAKRELSRGERTVDVDGCAVRMKLAYLDGAVVNAQPEYEDVAAAAAALHRPVKYVLAAAVAAAHLPTSRVTSDDGRSPPARS
ncbi:MAG: nickel pincer cofactor biosynthesis protein LarC [Streptosporangiales bacterium]|nr:nickel pincer cofactor biosynthesis protein LarC [Streptosporangiales bacterium]